MSIKKKLLLTSMALAMLVFVLPASASAAKWLYKGEPVKTHHTVHLTGTLTFKILGSTVVCTAHPTLTITEAEKAEFTQMAVTTKTCKGTGFLEGCEMIKDIETGLPWPADPTGPTTFLVTDFTLDTDWNCSKLFGEEEVDFIFEQVTATPDVPKAFNSVELSGKGTAFIGEEEVSAEIEGELEVTEGGAGLYGIG